MQDDVARHAVDHGTVYKLIKVVTICNYSRSCKIRSLVLSTIIFARVLAAIP
jgi:hypothetical protein